MQGASAPMQPPVAYGTPYPVAGPPAYAPVPPQAPPARKRTGCVIAVAIVVFLLLCCCCGVPLVMSATGQTVDLGEITLSDSFLKTIGVDKMIGDAIDTFFPWGSDGGDGTGQ